jgi:pilus assembly protein CpaE
MKIALISPSTKSLQSLSVMLEQGGDFRSITRHEGGFSKLRAVADHDRPDVIIVEGFCHDGADLMPVEFVTAHFPNIFIIMLCTQQNSEVLINAMRVGVREVLPSPVSQAALEAAILRAKSKMGLHNTQAKATVLAFVSCKGGSGATFLSTNIGHQLAEEGKKVLLMDLNLQFGEAALTVYDRKPTSDIAEVTHNLSRLDASFLHASVVHVSANYSILAAPDDPLQAQEIKPEHIDAILNVALTQYDYIILDVRRNLDDLMIKALDRSDKIFLVVQTLLPYVRNASRMMNVFKSLGYPLEKIEVLVNRFWKNDEIGLKQLRASLGVNKLRTIPNGYTEVAKAINFGVPLSSISKSSGVFKSICELAESLQSKDTEIQSGLLSRLLNY